MKFWLYRQDPHPGRRRSGEAYFTCTLQLLSDSLQFVSKLTAFIDTLWGSKEILTLKCVRRAVPKQNLKWQPQAAFFLVLDDSCDCNDAFEVDQGDEGEGDTEEDLNLEYRKCCGELPSAATVTDESKLQHADADCQLQGMVSMEETTLDESTMEVDAEAEPQGLETMLILAPDQIWLELEKFLHEKWFAIEFWEKVIKSRMRQAYSEAKPAAWPPGKMEMALWRSACVWNLWWEVWRQVACGEPLKIDDIEDESPGLVISMNDQDEKTKAEPSDWHGFFAWCQIPNIRYQGWDEIGIRFGTWNKGVEKIWEFVTIYPWLNITITVERRILTPGHVLFWSTALAGSIAPAQPLCV